MKSLSRVQLLASQWTAAYQCSSIHGIFQARVLDWGAIASIQSTLCEMLGWRKQSWNQDC